MKEKVKLLIFAIMLLFIVYLIADYFNREGISGVFSFDMDKKHDDENVIPFKWDMESSDELQETSENVKRIIINDGKLNILFEEEAGFLFNQRGRNLNILENSYMNIVFWSSSEGFITLNFIKDERIFVSRRIYYRKGWNRIKQDLLEWPVFYAGSEGNKLVDWEQEGWIAGKIYLKFTSSSKGYSYINCEYFKLVPQNYIMLKSEHFKTWSRSRNIKYDKTNSSLVAENKDYPVSLIVGPLGFPVKTDEVELDIDTAGNIKPNMLIFFRYYYFNHFMNNEPGIGEWIFIASSSERIIIPEISGNMLELRVVLPPGEMDRIGGITGIKIKQKLDASISSVYFTDDLDLAGITAGSRVDKENINFVPLKLHLLNLSEAYDVFLQLNYLRALNYSLIGIIPDDSSGNTSELIRIFRDYISLWVIDDAENAKPELKEFLFKQVPHARILNRKNSSEILRQEFNTITEQKVTLLTPSFLIMNRGLLFYLGIVMISGLFILALKDRIGMHFRFGRKELKYFGYGLILSVVILLPLLFVLGLGSYKFVTINEIMNGLYRYGISSLVQELLRIVAIEFLVLYALQKEKIIEKKYYLALVLTSVFFSLGHLGYPGLDFSQQLSFLLITLFAGMIFGFVYIKTKSLTAPTLLHIIADIFLFVFTTM